MRHLLALALLLACGLRLHGADYAPAATALIDWTPNTTAGVGVPGGIPARATISSTLTATGDMTDRGAEIYNALYLAGTRNTTVQLGRGKFYVGYREYNYGINDMTLRGFGTDPAESGADPSTGGTEIICLSSGNGFNIRGSDTSSSTAYNVTGSPVKGDTTISISNSNLVVVNAIMHLKVEDDETLPVIALGGYDWNRTQTVFVTGVDTGAGTVTFQPPLYQTPVKRTGGALAMTWAQHGGPTAVVRGFGIEDLTIDGTALANLNAGLLKINGAHGSWAKNIRLTGMDNYGLQVGESVQCEFRQVTVDPNVRADWAGSSHGGLELGLISACLFEDNIITKHQPLIMIQSSVSGNVFGYNFGICRDGGRYPFITHNVGNFCNLYEGNSTTGIFKDSYFGSSADDVYYRNDLHGVIDGSAQPGYPVFFGRFTRRFEVVGNQMGRAGTTLNIQMGIKHLFNEGTFGTSNNYSGDPEVDTTIVGTLTTRTSDTVGVFTATSTLGTLARSGQPSDDIGNVGVRWGSSPSYVWRAGMVRGAIDTGALTVAISGGSDSVLPAEGTAIRLYYGPNGYYESDGATAASLVALGNYYYSESGIPAAQALGSTTLPASLYRSSAPSFMSGYNWPPYDPVALDPRYEAIPAGARYVASLGGGGTPTHTPGRMRNLRRR